MISSSKSNHLNNNNNQRHPNAIADEPRIPGARRRPRTTLESPPYNITFDHSTPLWSSHLLISSPSTLVDVHRAFLSAGADIILTATYQSSFEGFARTDPQYTTDDAARYMRSAIPLARQAFSSEDVCSWYPRVALSLGPYGATMSPVAAEYSGEYPEAMSSEGALREWHGKQLEVFAEDEASWQDINYITFETVRRADRSPSDTGGSPRYSDFQK